MRDLLQDLLSFPQNKLHAEIRHLEDILVEGSLRLDSHSRLLDSKRQRPAFDERHSSRENRSLEHRMRLKKILHYPLRSRTRPTLVKPHLC
jgi:hypothetical protein